MLVRLVTVGIVGATRRRKDTDMSKRFLRITSYCMAAVLLIAFWAAMQQRNAAAAEVEALAAQVADMKENPYVLVIEQPTEREAEIDAEELELLAKVIFIEMGSDAHPDTELYCTGSVVLNRVQSKNYPDTMREVVYQTSPQAQYGPAARGEEGVTPTPRCYRIAEDLLKNGSRLPPAVVGQSEEAWGPIFRTYTSPVTGETIIYWMEAEE